MDLQLIIYIIFSLCFSMLFLGLFGLYLTNDPISIVTMPKKYAIIITLFLIITSLGLGFVSTNYLYKLSEINISSRPNEFEYPTISETYNNLINN